MENKMKDFFKGRIGQTILESTLLQFGYKVERIGCEISPVVEKEDMEWPELLPDLKVTAPNEDTPVYLEVKFRTDHPLEALISKSHVDMLKAQYPDTVLVFVSSYNGSINCLHVSDPVISDANLDDEGNYRLDLLSEHWKPLWEFFPLVVRGDKSDELWEEMKEILGDFGGNRVANSRNTGFFIEEEENLKNYIQNHWHPGMMAQDINILDVEHADISQIWEHAMSIHAFRFAFDLCGGEANMDHPAFSQVMDKLLGKMGEQYITIPYQDIKEALGTHPELYARLQALEDEVSRSTAWESAFILMEGLLEIIPPGIGKAYILPEKGSDEGPMEVDFYTVLRLLQKRNCLDG